MTHPHPGRRILLGAFVGICLLGTRLTPVLAAQEPAALVSAFHKVLLNVMREAKTLGFQGRYSRLKPAIETSFDLRIMAQIATGSFWRKMTAEQRTRLVDVFSKISISIYANRFSGYSGQTFNTLGGRSGPQKTRLVEATIRNPDGKNVVLTYVTKDIKGNWRIIDVLLDTGVSELAVRRSEYRRILKSDGVDGLINRLEKKAAALAR